MAAVAVALVAVSVLLADRLAAQVTGAARRLAAAAAALGGGDLTARSEAVGAAGADRGRGRVQRHGRAAEPHDHSGAGDGRRPAAPAAHPADRAADERGRARRRAAPRTRPGWPSTQMEQEVDKIIRAARRPALGEPSSCDAAEVLAERMDFWSALADDQFRAWHLVGADLPVPVPVARQDLIAAADALLGNVFLHTAEGTEFAVTLHAGDGVVASSSPTPGPGSPTPARRCSAAAAAAARPGSAWTSPGGSPSRPAASCGSTGPRWAARRSRCGCAPAGRPCHAAAGPAAGGGLAGAQSSIKGALTLSRSPVRLRDARLAWLAFTGSWNPAHGTLEPDREVTQRWAGRTDAATTTSATTAMAIGACGSGQPAGGASARRGSCPRS